MKSKSQLRLKNIENDYNEAYDYIFEDIPWLISRCKRLEEALKAISTSTIDHQGSQVPTPEAEIARKALEE